MQAFRLLLWAVVVGTSLYGLSGCSGSVNSVQDPILQDGKYDAAFPSSEASVFLEEMLASVRLINSVAYYKRYVFSADRPVEAAVLTADNIEDLSIETAYFTDQAAGTATILQYQRRKVILLTSAHIIDFPDTLAFFFEGEDGTPGTALQSLAIKERQHNYIPDLEGVDNLDVLAVDAQADIALVGQQLSYTENYAIPVFSYPLGQAEELTWGSFVYVLGYPLGVRMITRGLVSKSFRSAHDAFVIDANFNQGFSGGVVLALRDGVPNFEWVGVVTASAASTVFDLVPDENLDLAQQDPHQPYDGNLYLKKEQALRYGVTIAASIDVVREFVARNRRNLSRQGYTLDQLGAD